MKQQGIEHVEVLYDGECPFCVFGITRYQNDAAQCEVERVDARADSSLLNEAWGAGLNINKGMVVKAAGQLYYGGDAVHQLAIRADRRNLINRISHVIFRSRARSVALYPYLRVVRDAIFHLKGAAYLPVPANFKVRR